MYVCDGSKKKNKKKEKAPRTSRLVSRPLARPVSKGTCCGEAGGNREKTKSRNTTEQIDTASRPKRKQWQKRSEIERNHKKRRPATKTTYTWSRAFRPVEGEENREESVEVQERDTAAEPKAERSKRSWHHRSTTSSAGPAYSIGVRTRDSLTNKNKFIRLAFWGR